MTGEEYISLTKKTIAVKHGRYEDIIRIVFATLAHMDCLKNAGAKIDLKIISSASMSSEVVDTKPALTLIWDNYQWEIIEKFLLSALLYINKQKGLALQIYKMNIYMALSIRTTYVAPELSYLFAKKYRDIRNSTAYDFVMLYSTANIDILYCQLLALGHEFSHILFERMDFGSTLYNIYENDFFCIMDGAIKSKVISNFDINGVYFEELIHEIKTNSNMEYRKELICDIYSYTLVGEIIEKINSKLNNERTIEDLYDDIITMYEFIIRTMNAFSYILEYWTRFGNFVCTKRFIKPYDLHLNIPNFDIWKKQYYSRENLVSIYIRTTLLRDRQLYVATKNKKNIMLFNANSEMAQKLLSFEDKEWAEIICELQHLMRKNISLEKLIEARDGQLQI